jgi:uncharacterized NAD-dependent epimerase/dehydratase family protein
MKVVIYAEKEFKGDYSKMALGVLRFGTYDVVGVIDSLHGGKTVQELYPFLPESVPIFSSIREVLPLKPETLIIGIAPKGGGLPAAWRSDIALAMEHGLSIYSGLHFMFKDDPEFKRLAERNGVKLWDVRDVPTDLPVGSGRVLALSSRIILTVGTDCKIGKMTCAILMEEEMKRRGIKTAFIPTGQIGILIKGYGLSIDRVIGDFMSGAVEQLIFEHGRDADYIIVEGQGALMHLGYSAVTLGILHGALPDFMVLCHEPARKFVAQSLFPLPTLDVAISQYETMISSYKKTKVVGISLKCPEMSRSDCLKEVERVQNWLSLPTTDPMQLGVSTLVDAILREAENKKA